MSDNWNIIWCTDDIHVCYVYYIYDWFRVDWNNKCATSFICSFCVWLYIHLHSIPFHLSLSLTHTPLRGTRTYTHPHAHSHLAYINCFPCQQCNEIKVQMFSWEREEGRRCSQTQTVRYKPVTDTIIRHNIQKSTWKLYLSESKLY